MSFGHYVELCRICRCVISQCRCPSQHKTLRLSVCATCAKRVTDADDPTPVQGVPLPGCDTTDREVSVGEEDTDVP